MNRLHLFALMLPLFAIACQQPSRHGLTITWKDEMLTMHSPDLPAEGIETWYLEAYCRPGSTDRDWLETTLPSHTELLSQDPAGKTIALRTMIDGKVRMDHHLTAEKDNVDIRIVVENLSDETVPLDWAQPCMRVGGFTGRGQDDYFERCFIFTDQGFTWMSDTHREMKARYVPGQVYVPAGVNLNDVNPRPISQTRPVNGLVGAVSADNNKILAMAFDRTHELFQGIIICIHNDFNVGSLAPRERKTIHGKIYVLDNDPQALLARYGKDFPKVWPFQR